ncbi:MAG: hypothetical protein Q7U97_13250 [Rhodocyclaceae bacterium]|nr:hypothetical protein [Rhodocyclaceae bacterium]
MGTRQTQSPQQMLAEARRLAYANNMFVVDCEDKGVAVHVLYRRVPVGKRAERLGKSRSPARFRDLVKKCAVSK